MQKKNGNRPHVRTGEDARADMSTRDHEMAAPEGFGLPVRSGSTGTERDGATTARVRDARDDDLRAITDIYNEAILAGGSTADLSPRTLDQRREWVFSHSPRSRYPVVVLEDGDGTVVGFGSLSRFHPRQAYEGVVELSYYVGAHVRRHGYGTLLVQWLVSRARVLGYRTATAIIFSANAGSIALASRAGFRRYGMLPNACYDGKGFLDVSYWYREL
jgi:phosphinothricin acetyltransferase